MKKLTYHFSRQSTDYYLGASVTQLDQYADPARTILIVDETVHQLHGDKLDKWRKVIVPSGEKAKELSVFSMLIHELTKMEADRKTMLVGVGGGVVTDLTGFVASVYMRGVPFAFAPTTLLAQVDASIGGKNGINFERYKNLLGTVNQPQFILFDYDWLNTIPKEEWTTGFAEIIKYACILDSGLFDFLEANREAALQRDPAVTAYLVEKSVIHKSVIVQEDEFESNQRRWLNFGHTIGHAVEKLETIAHGKAVSIGMVAAAKLSEKITGLDAGITSRITALLEDYHLPVTLSTNRDAIYDLFKLDKKREKDFIHFVLLEQLGRATTRPVPLEQLKEMLDEL